MFGSHSSEYIMQYFLIWLVPEDGSSGSVYNKLDFSLKQLKDVPFPSSPTLQPFLSRGLRGNCLPEAVIQRFVTVNILLHG
jgi:hypothetical protein